MQWPTVYEDPFQTKICNYDYLQLACFRHPISNELIRIADCDGLLDLWTVVTMALVINSRAKWASTEKWAVGCFKLKIRELYSVWTFTTWNLPCSFAFVWLSGRTCGSLARSPEFDTAVCSFFFFQKTCEIPGEIPWDTIGISAVCHMAGRTCYI